jgi:hypothetical protein
MFVLPLQILLSAGFHLLILLYNLTEVVKHFPLLYYVLFTNCSSIDDDECKEILYCDDEHQFVILI